MLPESKVKTEGRFLIAIVRLSQQTVELWQKITQSRCKGKKKNKQFQQYINWRTTDNEIGLYTLYAYADFEIPKKFSCFFDYQNPDRFVNIRSTLTQSIWEGWFPIDRIENGNKHLTIFQFEEQIPSIIKELYEEKTQSLSFSKDTFLLGICQIEAYESIKKKLLKV